MAGNNALTLKFGTDFGDTGAKLAELAGNVTRNMAMVSAAAVATSATLRTSIAGGAADASRSLVGYIATWENAKTAAMVASEAMKVGFAVQHPVMAIGTQLLGNYKYALGAVAAGALTAVEAIKFMNSEIERANSIIAGAEKAGVSTTFFQAWTDQAAKARLTAGEMEQALQHATTATRPTFDHSGEQQTNSLTKWSDELQNGRKFATESYDAIKNAGQDMDKWVTAAALVVRDYQRAAEVLGDVSLKAKATQIATEFFGENGRKFAAGLADGSIQAKDIAKAAEDAGRIYSTDLLKATADVNQQLALAKDHLSKEMHPTMEGLVKLSNTMLGLWAGIVEKVAQAAAKGNEWLGAGVDFAALGSQQAAGALAPVTSAGAYPGLTADALRRSLDRRQTNWGDGPDVSGGVPQPPSRLSLTEIAKVSPHVAKPSKETADAKEALDTYIDSLIKANAVTEAEIATLGKSNIEKARAVDLVRAQEAARRDFDDGKRTSATLTDEERTKVLGLAEAEGRLADARTAAQRAQEAMKAAQNAFADSAESGIEQLIVDHKRFADVLRDIVKELERAALKSLISGKGSLAGITGTEGKDGAPGGLAGLLGGFFNKKGSTSADYDPTEGYEDIDVFSYARGGMVGSGPTTRVPSSVFIGAPQFALGGGIPSILHAGEIVLNAGQQQNVASRMSGPGNITQHFHLNGTIAESDVHQMVQRGAQTAAGAYAKASNEAPSRSW